MMLSGVSGEEALDEQEAERYAELLSHPLEINLSSKSRLLSSGLLTQYQAASLLDYRLRFGDIRSISELSLVEGFGKEWAAAMAPFVSFRSRSRSPGQPVRDSLAFRTDILTRGAFKDGDWNYGLKLKLAAEDKTELTLAARTTYSDGGRVLPSAYSLSLLFYGGGRLGKIVAGDYNARFGQGLSLWGGMSMSGLSSPSSFYKRPSGLSPSWSYSGVGTHRGLAADFLFGRFVLSSFVSFPGLRGWCENGKPPEVGILPGMNLAWFGRDGQVSLTAFCCSASFDRFVRLPDGRIGVVPEGKKPERRGTMVSEGKLSVDFRWSRGGVEFFGELGHDFIGRSQAVVAGGVAHLPGESRLSMVLRCYPREFSSEFAGAVCSWSRPTNELGGALGFEWNGAALTADFARKAEDKEERQCKLVFKVPLQLSDRLVLSFRGTERIRPDVEIPSKTGVRLDLDYSSSGISRTYGPSEGRAWKGRLRFEGMRCRSLAGLAYLETGRKEDWGACYLRGTVFLVDNWDDRIYSYERDAPGNFTVPAYYGRGWSLSAVLSGKVRLTAGPSKTLKLHLRASMLGYSLMKDPKPSSFEVKLQAVLSL